MDEKYLKNQLHHAAETRLSGLVPDPLLAQRVLKNVEGEEKVKKKLSVGFVLVIVFVFVAVTAIAMNYSYVLEYVFGKNVENAQRYTNAVQTVDIVHEGSEIKTTIKDALWNDNTLSVGLGFEISEPVFIVTDTISINDIDCEIENSSIESRWVGTDLHDITKRQTAIHGFSIELPKSIASDEVICVKIQLSLLKPQKAIHFIDTYAENKRAMWKEIDAAVENEETPVDQDEPYAVLVSSGWLGDEFDDETDAQHPLNSTIAYLDYSNMVIIDTVDVTFDICP